MHDLICNLIYLDRDNALQTVLSPPGGDAAARCWKFPYAGLAREPSEKLPCICATSFP
jgi:hypothetical protein